MASYNVRRFLAQALDSIISQTVNDFEFLIVEGGSTDGSREILEACRDPRIRILKHPCGDDIWRWFVTALNKGLCEARGELIARMDADDVSHPTRFEQQIGVLNKDNGLVLLATGMDFVTEAGVVGRRRHSGELRYASQHGNVVRLPSVPHGSVMFRKDAAKRAGLYRTVFRSCEDRDMWHRLADLGRVALLDEPLYLYRICRESITAAGEDRNDLYGKLITRYALERRRTGSDPVQRGEPLPPVPQASRSFRAWTALYRNSQIASIEGNRSTAILYAAAAAVIRPFARHSYGVLRDALLGFHD